MSPTIKEKRTDAVVDYLDASDQKALTLGARATLRALSNGPGGDDTCYDGAPCAEVKVTDAALTTVDAPTAKGTASVPAWSYTVDGLPDPMVLPAVRVTTPAEISPGAEPEPAGALHFAAADWLLSRAGTTLRVSLQVPSCDTSHYRRHVLETDAAIVVWATATPTDHECLALPRVDETFTLRAPVGDRPVINPAGLVLLPPQSPSSAGWP